MIKDILIPSPYNLKRFNNNSDVFYEQLEVFTGCVLKNGKLIFFNKREFVFSQCPEENDSEEDILLDILITGTLWNEYKSLISHSRNAKKNILKFLFKLRKRTTNLKHGIDTIRGYLTSRWIKDDNSGNFKPSAINLKKLADTLYSTGEYEEESKRITKLCSSIEKLGDEKQKIFFEKFTDFNSWFKTSSVSNLGFYTENVNQFLKTHPENYKNREDYFFCGKKEVEYHLNMVGASIMNRNLKDDFNKTEEKILMLPTCLCKNENCKAFFDGNNLKCAHCSPECNVNKISAEMDKKGIKTILIKHSSDLQDTLNPWANQSKTGVIGTACVLNLLQGGFGMKKLSIPSQCVYLDYCGCKNHWNKRGIPTNLNTNRVTQLALA
jgi:hypothetical protein